MFEEALALEADAEGILKMGMEGERETLASRLERRVEPRRVVFGFHNAESA